MNFNDEVLKVIPLWVKLPNLPLNCWGPESLSRIGSVLGVPLYADECTTKQWRVSFARLLIEMDVTSPSPEYVWLEDDNGLMFKQVVHYDWKPPYCTACKVIGHNCAKKKAVPKTKKVWVPKPAQPVVTSAPSVPPDPPIVSQEEPSVNDSVSTPANQVTVGPVSTEEHGWPISSPVTKFGVYWVGLWPHPTLFVT